ncbi:TetR family transcriptional regulator [Nocardia transvalensis]|uniref:TetR family transcriptional regulator n=1 Tax=Nocardia transvalensis TaxID=37333 RepID=UPI001894B491|nr:TetR family transcriptional regulator [Nocardia transvalensis]MBF6334102.1 TetR family transcriptional regulator [Nocardia transvalensis]
MSQPDRLSVRERTRRALRAELVALAQDLFITQGYDETTLDDITAAAGMSRRTFFRYFSSKEELVLSEYELLGDALVAALADRPGDEPIWVALRRMLDVMVDYFEDPAHHDRAIAMEKVVQQSPRLTAASLERVTPVLDRLTDLVRERLGNHDDLDPQPAALVGAASSCYTAAKTVWIASEQTRPFADLLDQAMAALTPV